MDRFRLSEVSSALRPFCFGMIHYGKGREFLMYSIRYSVPTGFERSGKVLGRSLLLLLSHRSVLNSAFSACVMCSHHMIRRSFQIDISFI